MSSIPGMARPGVLSLAIKEKSALYAAYMPYIKGGGLFIPSTRAYQLGDEVFMLLTLLDDINKIPVAGKVVWITPVGCHGGKTPGIGVQFDDNENGIQARNRIEGMLGSALKLVRPTHTI